MSKEPKCPKCDSENTYPDGEYWMCPDCSHEWSKHESKKALETTLKAEGTFDAFGNVLNSGDSIVITKDLKIKGSSSVLKVGTKVKNIRLIDSEDGHNIACKIDGIGAMNLKSEFVKKAL